MSNEICFILRVILLLSTPVHARYCSKYTRALDVVFLLDSGPDISDDDWNSMTQLARDASYQLYASTFGTHVAQVQFSSNTSIVHGLGTDWQVSFTRPESFETGRNLADALDTTRRLVLNNTNGDRPEVPDVIVPVTHGLSDDKSSAISQARGLKAEGIRIIPVGVTNTQVDLLRGELRDISTDPEDVDSLMLINRNYFSTVLSYLIREICSNRVEAANESLRLADGTSNTGRLECYINEEWVTVCSAGWTNVNTKTACEQLGFPAGLSMYTRNQTFYHRRVGVANIKCGGNETNLFNCPQDSLFHIDPSCDHQQDVFLHCLCGECNDYNPADNVRLADGTSISGRLEVFSPGLGWGGVCNIGWTAFNTRVACRQLGFLDGAGNYQRNRNPSITPMLLTLMLFHVSCFGYERTLFDCKHTAMSVQTCTIPVNIRCECHDCIEFLLQAPQQKDAMTQSTVSFEWHMRHNVSAFEFLFLSQKNPQTLMYVEEGKVIKEHTRFRNRIQLTNIDYETVGFNLADITIADMGMYTLHVPNLLLDSKAILIVTDFAVVPDPVVYREINDRVVLSWDLTALRQIPDINHEILLTTPATGRVHIGYYYTHWLIDNSHRHTVPEPMDTLHPTIIINKLTTKDVGNYGVEVALTSSVYQWLNFSWQFATNLYIDDNMTDFMVSDSTTHRVILADADYCGNVPMIVGITVLGILLGISVLLNIGLIYACGKRNEEIQKLISSGPNFDQRQDQLHQLDRRDCRQLSDPEEDFNDDRYHETNNDDLSDLSMPPTEGDKRVINVGQRQDQLHESKATPRKANRRRGDFSDSYEEITIEDSYQNMRPVPVPSQEDEEDEDESLSPMYTSPRKPPPPIPT